MFCFRTGRECVTRTKCADTPGFCLWKWTWSTGTVLHRVVSHHCVVCSRRLIKTQHHLLVSFTTHSLERTANVSSSAKPLKETDRLKKADSYATCWSNGLHHKLVICMKIGGNCKAWAKCGKEGAVYNVRNASVWVGRQDGVGWELSLGSLSPVESFYLKSSGNVQRCAYNMPCLKTFLPLLPTRCLRETACQRVPSAQKALCMPVPH